MREILFRGKTADKGEWIEGSLLIHTHFWAIKPITAGRFLGVDPETVGQFTGLTDKNGKKIFEGDIVKFCDILGTINYTIGCYCVKTNKPDWRSRTNPAIDIVMNEYTNEIEVIGNIHDNPEFLKGGE